MVEQAQARKAPVQQLADVVAGKFTWGVLGICAATAGFWGLVGTSLWPHVLPSAIEAATSLSPWVLGAQLATAVACISCPCALGLATPTSMLVGSTAAATHGLLVRGGDALERASKVQAVVFDKVGADGGWWCALMSTARAVTQGRGLMRYAPGGSRVCTCPDRHPDDRRA